MTDKTDSESAGVNLDKIQSEAEKLVELLKNREISSWRLPMHRRMENLKKLTSQYFDKNRKKWKIWKTINIGTIKTCSSFRRAMKKNGFQIDVDILGRVFKTVSRKSKVDLVSVSVAELGFPKGARVKYIFTRAQERGLDLCPAEVGPQLRLQYQDQKKDEHLYIAMEPILSHNGYLARDLVVFGISHQENSHNDRFQQWLYQTECHSDYYYSPEACWVFALPKQRIS